MTLRESFQKVLTEYKKAMEEPFARHPLADFLRTSLPEQLQKLVEQAGDYEVKGSAGQANWARSPWVAILDPLLTDSAQRGYYPVYLFREDFTGFYLSLNQGVTDVRQQYRSEVKHALKSRAADFRARLGEIPKQFAEMMIDLRPSPASSYSADYEAGNICAKFYDAPAVPEDDVLIGDLLQILQLYARLSYGENLPAGTVGAEDDEQGNDLIEDFSAFRQHKRIERNPAIAARVKKALGYVCQACGFSFEKTYVGVARRQYIEAHHLVPIAMLKGKKVSRDPKRDFAVLCANCHRMIHRFESPWDLEAFGKTIGTNINRQATS